MDIGERMKLRRKELNLSADIVAEKLGVSRSTIFRYEKGDIEKLPTNILDDIAEVLKTTPAFLMGWEDENAPSIGTIYKQLNPERQTKVYNFAEYQLREQNKRPKTTIEIR
ncbi:helix-turn-helix domain-containing protein, partial [Bifidobacterium pseudocatenulatum]|nr:helix-turn-helix domain-containing protein [Bifidobacterium pseudocatenulatum]